MDYAKSVNKLKQLLNSLELQGRSKEYHKAVYDEIKTVLDHLKEDPYINNLVRDTKESDIESVKYLVSYIQRKLFSLENNLLVSKLVDSFIELENLQERIDGLSPHVQLDPFLAIRALNTDIPKCYVVLPHDFNYKRHHIESGDQANAFDISLAYTVSQSGMLGETYYIDNLDDLESKNPNVSECIARQYRAKEALLNKAVSYNKMLKTAIIEFNEEMLDNMPEILEDLVMTLKKAYARQGGSA